jgi:EpsI family protein
MLLAGVLLLYFIDGLLARFVSSPRERSAATRGSARDGASRLGARVAVAFGFSAVLLAVSWLPAFPRPSLAVESPANALEPSFDGWVGVDQSPDWMFYGTAAFGQVVNRRYGRGGEAVDVFIGQAPVDGRARSYLSQKAGYPGSGWTTEREQSTRIAGREATLRVLRKGAARLLAVSWFEASPGLAVESARALLALDSTAFLDRKQVPLAVRLSTPIAGAGYRATESGRQRLERFAEHISPTLQHLSTPRES